MHIAVVLLFCACTTDDPTSPGAQYPSKSVSSSHSQQVARDVQAILEGIARARGIKLESSR